MSERNKALAIAVRAALLAIVDALEEWLDMERTKDIRKWWKQGGENYAGYAGE